MFYEAIIHFLRHIPASNQPALPLSELASESNHAAVTGFMVSLRAWGLIDMDGDRVRATSQTALYALHSLAEWLASGEAIITDWETRGTANPPLTNGASFLRLLEEHRLQRLPNAAPTRHEHVAQVLIKRHHPVTHQPQLLFQYDANAGRYQLIGGRYSPARDADMHQTIIREIAEELPHNTLTPPVDYQLREVISQLTLSSVISPTFGALTGYTFTFFHMVGLKHPLILSESDRWLDIATVLKKAETDPADLRLFSALQRQLGSLELLPDSFGHIA